MAAKSGLPTRVMNKKFMRSFPVPAQFFIGAKVYKRFGSKWYGGTVDQVHQDEDTTCWHVTYTDFDEEDLDAEQLAEVIIYHPLVDASGDLEVPKVGQMVWFAQNNVPVMGQVTAVDATTPRPITVQVWVPKRGTGNILKATFQPKVEDDGHSTVVRLTVPQVVLTVDKLTPGSRLSTADQQRLSRFLRS